MIKKNKQWAMVRLSHTLVPHLLMVAVVDEVGRCCGRRR
jgi:hypothetical protein